MLAGLACLAVLAQGSAPKAETALISDVTTIKAGTPFTVALQIKMPPEWHTYYLNPGDAGQATEIHWKLPAGFTAGAIQWPVPERAMVAGIASYVYENEVWLLTTITPPKTLASGMPIHLSAHITWLLCSSACVPQASDLSVDLKSAPAATPDKSVASQFEAARHSLPVTSSKVNAVAQQGANKGIRLVVQGVKSAEGVQFIPADVDSFGANESKAGLVNGVLTLDLPLTPYAKGFPPRVKGILVTPGAAYAIDASVVRT